MKIQKVKPLGFNMDLFEISFGKARQTLNLELSKLASEFQHLLQPSDMDYKNVAMKLLTLAERVEKLRLLFEKYGPGYSIPLCFKRRCQVLKSSMRQQSAIIKPLRYNQSNVVSVVQLLAMQVGRFTAQKEAHNDRFATGCDRFLDDQADDILSAPHDRGNEEQQSLLGKLWLCLDLEVKNCGCQLCFKGLYREMLRTSLFEPLRDLASLSAG